MNRSAELAVLVPFGVVTVTSTVPVPGGEIAVIWPELSTLTLVPAFGPKPTTVAPVKFLPVIVTLVPPPVGPDAGFTPVTAGIGIGLTVAFPLAVVVPPPASFIVMVVVYDPARA